MKMTDYNKQATDFLTKTNTEIKVIFNRQGKYFDDDKNERDIYDITLKRGNRTYTFTFGQSVQNSGEYALYGNPMRGISHKKSDTYAALGGNYENNKNYQIPTAYDILASLEKYDPGTFENFCSEFGYDTDSRKAEKTYKAVKEQFTQLQTLFNDTELEEMSEIQ